MLDTALLRPFRVLAARLCLSCLVLFLVLCASAAPALAQAEERGDLAILIPIEGTIDARVAALLKRGLDEARSRGASRVILAIDTPGGQLDVTQEIVSMLAQLRSSKAKSGNGHVDTVAWIRSQGLSAGALISLSCTRIFMSSGATIGAATPILVDALDQVSDAERKVISAVRADARQIAQHRGKRVQLIAEAMVDPRLVLRELRYRDETGLLKTELVTEEELDRLRGTKGIEIVHNLKVGGAGDPPLTVGAEEALRIGLSEGVAESVDELVRELGIEASELERIEQSWSEELADFLYEIRIFLLIGGVIALLLALQIPGTGFPEVLAGLCFVFFFIGNYLVGFAEWTEIILFVMGVALVLVEAFVIPGTIVAGLAGIAAILVSVFLALQPFAMPNGVFEERILEENLWSLIGVIVSVTVLGALASRFLPRLPIFRGLLLSPDGDAASLENSGTEEEERMPLLGRSGRAQTDLRPSGKVEIDAEPYDVVSDAGFVAKGQAVRVIVVEGNRVVVTPIEDAPDGDAESGAVGISLLLLITLFGFLFLIAEVFIPSFGILSILSAVALISVVVMSFAHGTGVGLAFLLGLGTTVPIVVWLSLRLLPKTYFGKKLILGGPSFKPSESLARESGIEDMPGRQGVCVTDLRPAGTIEVEGRRWDAITRGELLEPGTPVEVLKVEMSQLVVRAVRESASEDFQEASA
ncbi:MAG: hypothetical protein CSA62_11140 [Planctomycetota bacterium]|nr:MAG: hypothetical protein CSA62_11140 [Planctomycetota bacterium]